MFGGLAICALFAVLASAPAARGGDQFAILPQAESPEEFDDYLNILEATTSSEQVRAAERFLSSWPDSALRGAVYARLFDAYRGCGDVGKAITAAEQALKHMPDNLAVLAELAVVLANGTRDAQRLARAAEAAERVIAGTKTLRLPRSISPTEWERLSARLKSLAHAALGLVANARGDLTTAVRQFELAVAWAPVPDASHHYRLGLLYRAANRTTEAARQFHLAAKAGDAGIRTLAWQQLEALGEARQPESLGLVPGNDLFVPSER